MPSIVTHNIFAKEILKKLDNDESFDLLLNNKEFLFAFAQSHDFLFFHKDDSVKKMGHVAHKNNTKKFIINIIQYIKDNNLQNHAPSLCYLYGVITHYVLDSICHPFIFYRTGVFNKKKASTYKYRGEHTHMEKDIDALYYKKYYNEELYNCDINNDMIGEIEFDQTLINLISYAYNKTYNLINYGEVYRDSIFRAKRISKLFMNDSSGFKRFIYQAIDKLFKNKFGYLEGYSTYNISPDKSFLNEEHNNWYNPANKKLCYNYSFDELFEISIKKCLKIIRAVHNTLTNNESIEFLIDNDIIEDNSYLTGLNLSLSQKMRKFYY